MNKPIKTLLLASAMLSIAGTASACDNYDTSLELFQQAYAPFKPILILPNENIVKAIAMVADKQEPIDDVLKILSSKNPTNLDQIGFHLFDKNNCHISTHFISAIKYMKAFQAVTYK